jgi:hypothetical protein
MPALNDYLRLTDHRITQAIMVEDSGRHRTRHGPSAFAALWASSRSEVQMAEPFVGFQFPGY